VTQKKANRHRRSLLYRQESDHHSPKLKGNGTPMKRPSTIETHPRRADIDQALLAGQSLRNVAERFGISTTALHRHKRNLAPAIQNAVQERQEEAGKSILEQVKTIQERTMQTLIIAETAKDSSLTLKAIGECRKNLELLARLAGDLGPMTGLPLEQIEGFVNLLFESVKSLVPVDQHTAFIDFVLRDPRSVPVAAALRRYRGVN
jgi:hypothetical protein